MMKWTHEKPKEPGYYWLKDMSDGEIRIVEITRSTGDDMDVWKCGDEVDYYLSHIPEDKYMWAGPLLDPDEEERRRTFAERLVNLNIRETMERQLRMNEVLMEQNRFMCELLNGAK